MAAMVGRSSPWLRAAFGPLPVTAGVIIVMALDGFAGVRTAPGAGTEVRLEMVRRG